MMEAIVEVCQALFLIVLEEKTETMYMPPLRPLRKIVRVHAAG